MLVLLFGFLVACAKICNDIIARNWVAGKIKFMLNFNDQRKIVSLMGHGSVLPQVPSKTLQLAISRSTSECFYIHHICCINNKWPLFYMWVLPTITPHIITLQFWVWNSLISLYKPVFSVLFWAATLILNSLRPSDTNMSVNLPSLIQIMACRLIGVKPLSEPMLEYC